MCPESSGAGLLDLGAVHEAHLCPYSAGDNRPHADCCCSRCIRSTNRVADVDSSSAISALDVSRVSYDESGWRRGAAECALAQASRAIAGARAPARRASSTSATDRRDHAGSTTARSREADSSRAMSRTSRRSERAKRASHSATVIASQRNSTPDLARGLATAHRRNASLGSNEPCTSNLKSDVACGLQAYVGSLSLAMKGAFQ